MLLIEFFQEYIMKEKLLVFIILAIVASCFWLFFFFFGHFTQIMLLAIKILEGFPNTKFEHYQHSDIFSPSYLQM